MNYAVNRFNPKFIRKVKYHPRRGLKLNEN